MITREEFEQWLGDEYTFKLRRLGAAAAIQKGLLLDENRLKASLVETSMDYQLQVLLDVATQEEQVWDYPDNFLSRWAGWWHRIKTKKIPRRIRKWFPAGVNRVWAIHKFPELNVPNELVGREFIHFKVVKIDKL